MKIVGCDLHTRYQQIAMLDQESGELIERRLEHENGEARAFYAALPAPVPGAPHIRVLCECVGVCAAPLLSVEGAPSKLRLGGLADVAISRSTPKIPHLFFITNAQ
jgi:hypothetical protein